MYYCLPGDRRCPASGARSAFALAGAPPRLRAATFDRAWDERDDLQAEGCAPSLGGEMWPYVARQVQGWTKLRDLP